MRLESIECLLLSIGLLLLGGFLKRNSVYLQRFCIPNPVIGGFCMAFIVWGLYEVDVHVSFDNMLQTPLMIAFFSTIGLGGSFKLLKAGGKVLLVYLICCWALAIGQNLIGVLMMYLFGLNPIYGILSGAVALEGGHGNAVAFSEMAYMLSGTEHAKVVAIAAATFGLIAGSLLGGLVATYLIRRHFLAIEASSILDTNPCHNDKNSITSNDFLKSLFLIICMMYFGTVLADVFIKQTGYALPAYVGSMIVAITIRNINDKYGLFTINQQSIDTISHVSLGIFLTMAMMNLRIWELSSMAFPLLLTLCVQVVALVLFALFVVFYLCGKDYDSAVMCAGFIGHGLGATPNAIANMQAVGDKYHVHSKQAFLIVPLCGSVFIDIVAVPFNTLMINLFA